MSIELRQGINAENATPHCKLFKMPGGEWHVTPEEGTCSPFQWAFVRATSADDLMALRIWADAVSHYATISAIIPYLPGARQDRTLRSS